MNPPRCAPEFGVMRLSAKYQCRNIKIFYSAISIKKMEIDNLMNFQTLIVLFLVFPICVSANFKQIDSNSFSFVGNDGNVFRVKVDGYIEQQNIQKRSVESALKSVSVDGEESIKAQPDNLLNSSINHVYAVELSFSGGEYGILPGIAFIIKMNDGKYLLSFTYRERLRYYTEPQVSIDPLMHQLSNSLHQGPMYFSMPHPIASEVFTRLHNSGSRMESEQGRNIMIITNLNYFQIAGQGVIRIMDNLIDYSIISQISFT